MKKKCVVCGGEFEARNRTYKICSDDACFRAYKNYKARVRRSINPKPVLKLCIVCRNEFDARGRQRAHICSKDCKERHLRKYMRDRHHRKTSDLDFLKRLREKRRDWYAKNREKCCRYERDRYALNPEPKLKRNRARYASNSKIINKRASIDGINKTAALQVVNELFSEPPSSQTLKSRLRKLRWYYANRERINEDRQNPAYRKWMREYQRKWKRKHNAKRTAALQLLRKLEAEGINAILST